MNRACLHLYPVDPLPEPFGMRSFDDGHGGDWQVALMEASFGNVLMVFSPIGADGAMLKSLDSANMREAGQLLAEADESTLRKLLSEATPWN